MAYENTLAFAQAQDVKDPLRSYREQFHIPEIHGPETIYFCGHSLGLQPKSAKDYLDEELKGWATLGVEGHFHSNKRPWFYYHKFSKEALAQLVGAQPKEVVSMNGLTTNLHLMMLSFFRPQGKRNKIIVESGAFPSDQYAFESQIKLHGLDPDKCLIELTPRECEYLLRSDDILSSITENADELALILLGGVQYYTGQLFDLSAITKAGHEVGARVGFDLAHAIGNVPLQLHKDQVDFAVWCSYKYLNSGPGGPGGIFVHEKHGQNPALPRLAGWWGYKEEDRFLMKKGFVPMEGADGWQLSNVNILSSAAHLASLEIFAEAGMEQLRIKSEQLTGYMAYLIDKINEPIEQIRIITSSVPQERGCMLSLLFPYKGKEIFERVTQLGSIVDWREPNVMRLAPVPLYNTFEEVFRFGLMLKKALTE